VAKPPLEPLYMIVYLDALVVKMRHEGRVDNGAVFVAIGVTIEGRCWDSGPAPRRSQAVAADLDRDLQSWSRGHPDRVRGWAERLPGSDRDGVSAYRSTTLRCTHCA
jgi:hypothetical protein